jgi:hypothetical protein
MLDAADPEVAAALALVDARLTAEQRDRGGREVEMGWRAQGMLGPSGYQCRSFNWPAPSGQVNVATTARDWSCGHRRRGAALTTASGPMCPRRMAFASSTPSSRRCPVAIDCGPRVGRRRSLAGTCDCSIA